MRKEKKKCVSEMEVCLVYFEQDDWGMLPEPNTDEPNQIFLTLRLWDERKGEVKDFCSASLPTELTCGKMRERKKVKEEKQKRKKEGRRKRRKSREEVLSDFIFLFPDLDR